MQNLGRCIGEEEITGAIFVKQSAWVEPSGSTYTLQRSAFNPAAGDDLSSAVE